MRAYITKYALTQGILEKEGEVSENMLQVPPSSAKHFSQYFHGKDWHKTIEEAKARAEEMRLKKIESLKKKLQALEDMSF